MGVWLLACRSTRAGHRECLGWARSVSRAHSRCPAPVLPHAWDPRRFPARARRALRPSRRSLGEAGGRPHVTCAAASGWGGAAELLGFCRTGGSVRLVVVASQAGWVPDPTAQRALELVRFCGCSHCRSGWCVRSLAGLGVSARRGDLRGTADRSSYLLRIREVAETPICSEVGLGARRAWRERCPPNQHRSPMRGASSRRPRCWHGMSGQGVWGDRVLAVVCWWRVSPRLQCLPCRRWRWPLRPRGPLQPRSIRRSTRPRCRARGASH